MEAPKGGLGRARRAGAVAGATGERSELGRKRGAGRWRTVVAKRASRAERAGNIDHRAITVNHSKARRTRQVVDTGLALTNFASILEKLHFHVALEEVRVTELLSY